MEVLPYHFLGESYGKNYLNQIESLIESLLSKNDVFLATLFMFNELEGNTFRLLTKIFYISTYNFSSHMIGDYPEQTY